MCYKSRTYFCKALHVRALKVSKTGFLKNAVLNNLTGGKFDALIFSIYFNLPSLSTVSSSSNLNHIFTFLLKKN